MMEKSKTLSSEIIHQNPWWTYKHDKYSLSNGEEIDYFYGETYGSSIVVPVLDDGRLLLIVQQRYLADKLSIEFPRGRLHKYESPIDGAKRELFEETGYSADALVRVGTFECLNGMFKDTANLFVADELEQKQNPTPDKTESIEVFYRRPDEFDDMIKRGEVWDGQTLAAWAMVRDRVMIK